MKEILEAIGIVETGGGTREFIRININGYDSAKVSAIKAKIIEIMVLVGCSTKEHYCNHDTKAICTTAAADFACGGY